MAELRKCGDDASPGEETVAAGLGERRAASGLLAHILGRARAPTMTRRLC